MRTALFVLCSVFTASQIAAPPSARAEEEARRVLVWDNARLHLAPDEGSRWIHRASWDDAERPDRTGEVQVLELVGDHGAFVRVTHPGNLDATCANYGVPYATQGYRLDLYVRKADLAPVLLHRQNINFADGTGYSLVPGVPVRSRACQGGACAVLARSELSLFELTVPEAHLGTSYSPGEPQDLGDGTGDTLLSYADLQMDEEPVKRRPAHRSLLEVRDRAPHALGALVTLQGPCGEYRVAVGEDAFVDPEMKSALLALIGTVGDRAQDEEARVVPADTPLEYPDGSAAGTVVEEQVFLGDALRPRKADAPDRAP